MFAAVNAAALCVMSLATAYFFLAAGLGIRELRQHRSPLGFQAGLGYGNPFVPLDGTPAPDPGWTLYFLIPCLNESAVIAQTVQGLVDRAGNSRIVLVDDASDDGTAQAALAAVADGPGAAQLTVLTRILPLARQGKGAALNTGYAHVRADVTARGLADDRVIVVVMDADGRLSDGAIAEVLPLFADPGVGGAQLAVRIRNRTGNALLSFQDHQFWTLSSLTQFGRMATGTVSLGGNGQFARLSALTELGGRPWSNSLTEDLDLAVSLAVRGWRLTTTPRAAVDQQGVARLGPLVRQRTRWYQGHMTAARRLPEVVGSTRMSHAASIELSLYLLVPWLFDLPWSVLYHLVLFETGLDLARRQLLGGGTPTITVTVALWYLLGFWPALVTALLARRRGNLPWRRALALGHCFVATNYLSYACAWRALARMIRGRTGWTKTARVAETGRRYAPRHLAGRTA